MFNSLLLASATTYQFAQVPRETKPTPQVQEQKLSGDKDFDGISDTNDRCPNLPAKNTSNGCPSIAKNTRPVTSDPGIYFIPTSRLNLSIVEKNEIKLGDIFKVRLLNPETKSVLSESKEIEVK